MSEHLPALQVALPLLGAPLCMLMRHRLLSRGVGIAVAWAGLWVSWQLLGRALSSGPFSYELGGFAPPLGIELAVDVANAQLLVLVSAIASVVFTFGPGSAAATVPRGHESLFYALLLLCLAGLLGITITGDAFNAFVFLEISSLSSYALVALGKHRSAPVAAFSYLIMGAIGGTFFMVGVGLMYQMTGTLNMADLAARLPNVLHLRTAALALGLLYVGISIKLAVFPLHQWLPNAYTSAPSVVDAFLAATSTKVMYYLMARVLFSLFGVAFVFGEMKLHYLLIPLSLAAMFMGSLAAIYQANLKRLLAYSSVAQLGYMTLGLALHNLPGLTAGLVHMFNHALMKGGLFLVVGCITYRVGSSKIDDLRGIGRRMPLTMAAFVVGGLALIGVPSTVGFISKWYLVSAALQSSHIWIAVLVLLSSLLSVVYVWRIIEVAYFHECDNDDLKDPPLAMLIPTWVLIGATVVFGLSTDLTVGVAQTAALHLLGGAR